jgi:menaquinone-dependent protoporphyrinogen IX oxidase
MKRKILISFLMFGVAFSLCACNKELEEDNNTISGKNCLIVYYSWSGNSRTVANELRSLLNCDIVEITPATPYTTNYSDMLNVAQNEISAIDASGIYPAITTDIDSIDKYTTVFVCYPLWWSRMATPVQSFLNKHSEKLNGKTIALVCTSSSSGISGTIADARRICPSSIFTESLHIRSANVSNARNLLSEWLENINVSTENPNNNETMKIKITVGSTVFTATLYDNATAQDLITLLPVSVEFSDYNNTEKICNLPRRLTTENAPAGYDPSVGDICIYAPWGNICIFYRDFGYASGLIPVGRFNSGIESFGAISGNFTARIELASGSNTKVEVVEDADYQVYPNPTSDYITVSGEFEQLTLLNANGVTVAETKENAISINKLPKGVYFLKIKDKHKQTITRKTIIK